MAPTLCITLLGDFGLARGDEPVTYVQSGRSQSLLAYLLLHRKAPQSRRRLAYLFWPDTTDAQARTNLRRELHHLRRALPDADRYLTSDSHTIRWNPDLPCRIDVAEFEEALAAADAAAEATDVHEVRCSLQRAVDLYRGDLLPGCYDRWIDGDRDRLRRECDRALHRLIEGCESEGDHAEAIRVAERLIDMDPLREASHVRLIELHTAAGDRAAALRAYGRCERVLERELGVEPGPATRQAREAAIEGAPTPSPTPPSASGPPAGEVLRVAPVERSPASGVPPLVGRAEERATMQAWIDRSGRSEGPGRGQLLLLLGEPGIGKTRLLDELGSNVRRRGGRTIRGRGFEAEMVRPYGAWIDALRSVPRDWVEGQLELGSLLPEVHASAGVPADRDRLFDAVARWLLDMGAEAGSVLVLLDDIQWVDEASAALLHYLMRVLADSPVLVACAARSGEMEGNPAVARCVRSLEREGQVQSLALAPMGREEVGALARSVDRGIDFDRVFTDSGGNPFFALEVAHALACRVAGTSDTLDDLIRNRLARLDGRDLELLSWAAALGRGFKPSTAALVAERPLPDLLVTLDRLERHGIIRPGELPGGDVAYDFAHDVVRRAAYTRLSGPRRRLVHLQIAHTLHGLRDPTGSLAGEVAHHAALGGDASLAASSCVAAGERCLRLFAHAEAAELARRGIEHARGLEDPERIDLHMALMRVAVGAGVRHERAADLDGELRALIAEAHSLGRVEEEAIGYSLLSVLNYDHDDFVRVHESSLQAADTLHAAGAEGKTDPGLTARTLGQTGACLASIERDMARAEALLLEAASLAERVGVQLVDPVLGLGIVRRFEGNREEAERLLERGLRLARAERDHYRAFESLTELVMLDFDHGRISRAQARSLDLTVVAEKLKGGSEIPFCAALDALARYLMEQHGGEDALSKALDELRRLDASRKLAYVQTHAAEADAAAGRHVLAYERATEAYEAARLVDHRSGIALAGALRVRIARGALGDPEKAEETACALRDELETAHDLSARAREALVPLAQGQDPLPVP